MQSNYREEIKKMVNSLPAKIETLDDIRMLPWAGNAAWDVPIMTHLDRVFTLNLRLPREIRKEGCELAGELMTGEDCSFATEEEFDEYVEIIKD